MAKIKDEDIDLLRDRTDIVELVSGYLALKKSGGHSFKGLCPFHSEKTPSFTVDTAKNVFHCFGCQEGGNVYHFVQKIENLPFPEAVEWLARKTGFELHYEETKPGEAHARGQKARLIAANEAAAAFFHEALMKLPAAEEARRYLGSRGFGEAVAKRWQLGYAPGRDSLYKHMLGKGFKTDEILKADLARKSERDAGYYDTFRQRVIFPTWDLNGDVVGFGARALGDAQPKYLNTSETPVFSKSRVMYGLHRAKRAIARDAAAIVVEGYTDVIALHEAGIEEAVATNGVALGETHFEILKKFTQRVVLMLDSDSAGQGATERSFGVHHRLGLEVMVGDLPVGRDPADVVAEDGPDGITKAIDAARPLLEFKLLQTLSKVPMDTPEARSRSVRAAAEVLGWLPDPIARHEYAFLVAQRVGVDPEVVQRALTEQAVRTPGQGGGADGRILERRLPGHVKVEREALRLLMKNAAAARPWIEGLEEGNFSSAARRELFRSTSGVVRTGEPLGGSMVDALSPDARSLFSELSVGGEEADEPSRVREVFVRLQVFGLEREIKDRRHVLQEVNPLDDPRRHDELFTQLVHLEAERRDLLRKLQPEGAV